MKDNEAVLKALFKVKDDEFNFARAIQIGVETEDAAKVAKETVHGSKPKPVNNVKQRSSHNTIEKKSSDTEKTTVICYRCGKPDHKANECRSRNSSCHYYYIKGHLEFVCRKKQKAARYESKGKVKLINVVNAFQSIRIPYQSYKFPLKSMVNSVLWRLTQLLRETSSLGSAGTTWEGLNWTHQLHDTNLQVNVISL